MSDQRVDYDRIAPIYNRRFEGQGQQGAAVAILSLAQALGARRILEVGCGTGRWLADLRPVTDQLYGLDLSAGMLRQAWEQQGAGAYLIQGRAEQLPFPDACFDLVYCVNAIHHFNQQRAFIFQARRLLRPGGALAVIGLDPRQHRDRWYIYDYFDGTFETDLARFPSWGAVLDWMIAANLAPVEWRPVERILDPKIGPAVLDDPFLKKDATSQLALLTDKEYTAGLRRLVAALDAAGAAGETLTLHVEILMRMLVGRVA